MRQNKSKRFLEAALVAVCGGLMYLAINAIVLYPTNIQFEFEKYIPFIPETMLIYLMIFPLLLSSIFTVEKDADFLFVVRGYRILIMISLTIFFLWPTTMPRPASPSGWPGVLFQVMWFVDRPNNLFPSLHTGSAAYIAMTNSRFLSEQAEPSKVLSWIAAILISLSTLLVKQHALLDALGGFLLGIAVFKFSFHYLRRA